MNDLVIRARSFALEKHKGQKYGIMPYAYHLQQVVSKLTYWKDIGQWEINDTHLAVAWLHDVIEDTDATYYELFDMFDSYVADSVVILTKSENYEYGEYISDIKTLPIAKIVKMADTLCNLEASILSGEMKRINKYSKQLVLLTEE